MRTKSIQLNTCGSSQGKDLARGRRGRGIDAACGHTQCAAIGPNLLSERHSAAVTMPTGHGTQGHGDGHNEPLHQPRELRMEARAEAETGAASLEAFAWLVLCSHCAAIALVICSSRDFNALTRSSTGRLMDKGEGKADADEMKRQS